MQPVLVGGFSVRYSPPLQVFPAGILLRHTLPNSIAASRM
jgi:hypothetical protein